MHLTRTICDLAEHADKQDHMPNSRLDCIMKLMRTIGVFFLLAGYSLSVSAQEIECGGLDSFLTRAVEQTSCRESDDCASVDLPPSFGCHRSMDKNTAHKVINVLDAYAKSCEPLLYTCYGPPPHLECENNLCVVSHAGSGSRYAATGAYDENGRPLR